MGDRPKTTADEIREATREAREVLKDIRNERREVEHLVRNLEKTVEDRFEACLKEGLEELGKGLRMAMSEGTDRIFAKFDEVFNLLMTGDKKGEGESLVDRVHQRIESDGTS